MYAESLMTILVDLGIQCDSAELCLDNTAAIAFVNGSGSQRTRHLKVRGYKIRQLIQSGWTVSHCPGEYQKADLLTKALPSVRLQFLCRLLQLGGGGYISSHIQAGGACRWSSAICSAEGVDVAANQQVL